MDEDSDCIRAQSDLSRVIPYVSDWCPKSCTGCTDQTNHKTVKLVWQTHLLIIDDKALYFWWYVYLVVARRRSTQNRHKNKCPTITLNMSYLPLVTQILINNIAHFICIFCFKTNNNLSTYVLYYVSSYLICHEYNGMRV